MEIILINKITNNIDESFKVTSIPFFILDFNLLSCQLDSFMFKVLYWVILYCHYIKVKEIHNTFTVSCEISKLVSFASLIMKNAVIFPTGFRAGFPINSICGIVFGSASSFCCLLKSIAINY